MRNNALIIFTTLLISFLLSALPLPSWIVWLRPDWVLLTVIFWVMTVPEKFNIGWAWVVGLLLDALTGTVLGAHAMAMTIVAFLVGHIHLRMRLFLIYKQMLVVGVLALLYQLIIFMILGVTSILPNAILYWLPCLTSSMLWPWAFTILRDYRRRLTSSVRPHLTR